MYSIHCTLYSEHYTVYSVQCTMYMYTVHADESHPNSRQITSNLLDYLVDAIVDAKSEMSYALSDIIIKRYYCIIDLTGQ